MAVAGAGGITSALAQKAEVIHWWTSGDDARVQFESVALRVDVSDYASIQRPTATRDVVLGIRPEHLRCVGPEMPRHAQATLGMIEPMGATRIAWLAVQGSPFAMQVEPMAALTTGAAVNLALDTRQVSLFDTASEQRL